MTPTPLLVADQIYSDTKAWPTDSHVIFDRIPGIEAPIPDTCRLFLCYRDGPNSVKDALGESKFLGKLPATATIANLPKWKQASQRRFDLVKEHVIARGVQPMKFPDGGNYNQFRCLVDWRGAEILARHDGREITTQSDSAGRWADGMFIDNLRNNQAANYPDVDPGENHYAQEVYLREIAIYGLVVWVNAADPHVWSQRDGSPASYGGERFAAWLAGLGVRGVYFEGYKWAAASANERGMIETALINCRDFGLHVCIGAVGGGGWEPLYDIVSRGGVEQAVYRSR